jgi:hypothetical protein
MSRKRTEKFTTTAGPKFKTVNPLEYGDLTGPHWTNAPLTSIDAKLVGRPTPYAINSLIDIARTRCIANVAKPGFEGLVTLGELGQTLRYLKNPFKTGLALANSLERKMLGIQHTRRRGRSEEKVRKNLADLHLEVVYGFMPLIKDVSSILEKLRPKMRPRTPWQTARANESHVYTDAWSQTETFGGVYTYTAAYKYKREVAVRPWILYENALQLTDNEEWGMSLSDIPAAAWELVPLSFLVDRMVNVGDLISAITPRAGTKRITHGYSVKTRHILTRDVSNYNLPNWQRARDGTGTDTLIEESFYRVPDIGVPTLALSDITTLNNDIGLLFSVLSITTQKLSNLSRVLPPTPKVIRLARPVNPKDRWAAHAHL